MGEDAMLTVPSQRVRIPSSLLTSFPPSLHLLTLSLSLCLFTPLCLFAPPSPSVPTVSLNLRNTIQGKLWSGFLLEIICYSKQNKHKKNNKDPCHCFKCENWPKLRFQTVWESEQQKVQVPNDGNANGKPEGIRHGGVSALWPKQTLVAPSTRRSSSYL